MPDVLGVRAAVLVTSVQPLRVWAFDRALVRFCRSEYPREGRERGWATSGFADKDKYVIKECGSPRPSVPSAPALPLGARPSRPY